MQKIISNLKNEEGSAIVIALIILVMLTMIGIVSTDNTVVELQIVRNEAIYRNNFYRAESAVIEAAQFMEVNNLTTNFDWIRPKGAFDMDDVGNWNWAANGNSMLSPNLDDPAVNNNTVYAAVFNGIAKGESLDIAGSSLFSYSVYGLFDSTTGQGRSLIRMGYNKRYDQDGL